MVAASPDAPRAPARCGPRPWGHGVLRLIAVVTLPLYVAGCASVLPTPAEKAALQASSYAGQSGSVGSSVLLSKRSGTLDEEFMVDALADLLEEDDRPIALEAQFRALELSGAGSVVSWSNPSTRVRGEVVPGPVYAVNMRHCRDFRHTVERESDSRTARATACRALDGRWQLLD